MNPIICEDCIDYINKFPKNTKRRIICLRQDNCIIGSIEIDKTNTLDCHIYSLYYNHISKDLFPISFDKSTDPRIIIDKLNFILKKIEYSILLG